MLAIPVCPPMDYSGHTSQLAESAARDQARDAAIRLLPILKERRASTATRRDAVALELSVLDGILAKDDREIAAAETLAGFGETPEF